MFINLEIRRRKQVEHRLLWPIRKSLIRCTPGSLRMEIELVRARKRLRLAIAARSGLWEDRTVDSEAVARACAQAAW
jgi:hypothetical protein